jgi:sugar-specific transcriptional regulator TrmB
MALPEKVSKATGISLPSSYTLIELMESKGIVREITGAQRKRMYTFDAYLNLFR